MNEIWECSVNALSVGSYLVAHLMGAEHGHHGHREGGASDQGVDYVRRNHVACYKGGCDGGEKEGSIYEDVAWLDRRLWNDS